MSPFVQDPPLLIDEDGIECPGSWRVEIFPRKGLQAIFEDLGTDHFRENPTRCLMGFHGQDGLCVPVCVENARVAVNGYEAHGYGLEDGPAQFIEHPSLYHVRSCGEPYSGSLWYSHGTSILRIPSSLP